MSSSDPVAKIRAIKKHPKYKTIEDGYDIALVLLVEPMRLQPGLVEIIPLANREPRNKELCYISGFGRLYS
uniref:Peptidase S1 domain-containing protein n=1 Tax=Romanomermis culicivorax TaxID=13658 RepID=A0A915JB26_ROMCU